jgi:hypothetical protein
MSHWLVDVWIRIQDILVVLHLSLFRLETCVCLSRGVHVAGVAWHATMRIMAGVVDLMQRNGDGRTCRILGGWAIERSGGTVCGLHHARGDEKHEFLGWASKPRSTVCEWFGLKSTWTVFSSLASKPVATFFSDLASKSVARVSQFGP